jgi:HAD superfamily hydrolase (TIGR01549 family)
VPEPRFDPAGLKAIVLDVDGTLYRQGPLRRAIALRLLRAHVLCPRQGWRTVRGLQAYRSAQEHLRAAPDGIEPAEAQLRHAAARTGIAQQRIADDVARWMEREPLPLIARYVRPGLTEFVRDCRARGLRMGVLSDYPAEAKLEALGVGGLFDAVLCAQSPEIGIFKPDPRGLLATLARLGTSAAETLYVGDRPEVDAAAAAAAAVPCAIVTAKPDSGGRRAWLEVTGFPQLGQLLFSF